MSEQVEVVKLPQRGVRLKTKTQKDIEREMHRIERKRIRQLERQEREIEAINQSKKQLKKEFELRTDGKYSEEYLSIATKMCEQGMTDTEIGYALGVTVAHIDDWRKANPLFDRVMRIAAEQCDRQVIISLYKRAVGYDFHEDRVIAGKIVRINRHAIPDVSAGMQWLSHRQRSEWGENSTGTDFNTPILIINNNVDTKGVVQGREVFSLNGQIGMTLPKPEELNQGIDDLGQINKQMEE